ncbi:hypothetical protein [Escherichia phage vB-Eco-KMB36]|nr:hypothetical protein [Escherichia phage vB-Eco-KMB36]
MFNSLGFYRVTYAATQQRIIFLIFVLFHQTQQSKQLLQEMQQ